MTDKSPKKNDDTKKKEPEIIGGGANSYASKMMRQLAETAPVASKELDISELPVVELPKLSEIVVNVPALPPITEEDVMQRFEIIYYDSCVERKERKEGEAIEMDDELLIDLIGYAGGKILPFTSQENLRIRLEPNSIQEGFGTALVGTTVGETKVIPLDVPQEDSEPIKVVFVANIKKAASLTFPKADDPEVLKTLEMGDSLEEVYGNIAEMLGNERAGLTLAQGMGMTLDAIANRLTIDIEEAQIEGEIRSQWSKTEGRFLMEKGLSRQDQEDALEGWLQDETTRETARQRLKIAAAVMMFAVEDPSELTEEEIDGFFKDYAEKNDLDLEKWRAEIADKEDEQVALLNEYIYLRTVTHLISEVTLNYEQ